MRPVQNGSKSGGSLQPVSAYSRIERFYLSAHADRGGLLGMIARYAPGKVILTYGEVQARTNLAGYLNGKHDVGLLEAGELLALKDSGRRRGSFMNTAPMKIEALKEHHARTTVNVCHDRETHEICIALPGTLDGSGFVLLVDASFVPKSGTRIDGVGKFWNGSQNRYEQGLELSCLAVMSWAGRHVFPVNVVQTQPRRDKADRLTQYRNQLQALLVQRRGWFTRHLKAVVADGQYAKVMFMDVVCGEGYAFVTKLQSNANLLYPFTGAHSKRRGARRKWASKVDFVHFTGWTAVPGEADERVWTRVVWGPHFERFFKVVVIQNLDGRGKVKSHVVLCSTDTTMPAQQCCWRPAASRAATHLH